MPFVDRAEEFLAKVDLAKSKLRRSRSNMFLCGGRLDGDPNKFGSVRDALLKTLPIKERLDDTWIILAEKARDALVESNFENLLDMEECVSAIVDAVVLIVESPGSICELGSFTKTDEIRKKLVAILSNEHYNTPSFITLGPKRYIEGRADGGVVEGVTWDLEDDHVILSQIAQDAILAECRQQVGANFAKQEAFDSGSLGHRIYIVLAIVFVFRSAKFGEIRRCIDVLGLDIPDGDIRKFIDTLEVCGLLKTVRYTSKKIYYVPRINRIPFDFAFKAGTADADRNQLRWLNRIRAEMETEENERLDIFDEHNDAV